MGFHLWIDDELAWAQGSYEYRPMGTAVISASDLFRRRDFDIRRKLRAPRGAEYLGQFASLGQLNGELQKRRRARRNWAAAGKTGGATSRVNARRPPGRRWRPG